MILISWKLKVNHDVCWEINKKEFVEGWTNLGAHNLSTMKKCLDQFRQEIKNPAEFKKFYAYTFDYLRESKTILSIEEAQVVWEMLGFNDKRWALFQKWIDFMQTKKVITKDHWKLFIPLLEQHPTLQSLASYELDGAWPTAFDEFVISLTSTDKDKEKKAKSRCMRKKKNLF